MNEITKKTPFKKIAQLPIKVLMMAVMSSSYKKLYVKMYYKEFNQKLQWG